MKQFKKSAPATIYRISQAVMFVLALGFVAVVILKGVAPLRLLLMYAFLVAMLLRQRSVAFRYVAMDGEILYAPSTAEARPQDVLCRIDELESVEFSKRGWLQGGYLVMTIRCRESRVRESLDLGAMGCVEVDGAAAELRARGIEVTITI